MKEVNPISPVINNHASIMAWELKITVLWKNQFDNLFKWLVDNNMDFTYSRNFDDETYTLEIHIYQWAQNLLNLAKELAKYDYHILGDNEDE